MNLNFKSGFVTIVGLPNVGKSSLLNAILGEKLAITASMVQTTRNIIKGVYDSNTAQIIFVDTPGIHKQENRLHKIMNNMIKYSLLDSDIIIFIPSNNKKNQETEDKLIEMFAKEGKKVILVINKIDLINKEEILNIINYYKEKYNFLAYVPVCATKKLGVNYLMEEVTKNLLPGPQYYEKDIKLINDQFYICEVIREQIINLTYQEVPHAVAINIEHIEHFDNLTEIQANIVVERDSQKRIIIGRQGKMIKEIGIRSRLEIQKYLDTKIFLKLHVKVEENWRENQNKITKLGFELN